MIEEIWAMQPRFAQRTRKRAFRLLEHPRFRAAYDFLVLRAEESAELTELAQWWTEAQALGHDELAERLAVLSPSAQGAPGEAAPPAKRKRARRRRGKRRGAGAAAPQAGESAD